MFLLRAVVFADFVTGSEFLTWHPADMVSVIVYDKTTFCMLFCVLFFPLTFQSLLC